MFIRFFAYVLGNADVHLEINENKGMFFPYLYVFKVFIQRKQITRTCYPHCLKIAFISIFLPQTVVVCLI
jgi:hypothetical protein